MIGRSAMMRALFRRIERVAPIDVPVLILGESGTGKELVARAIQQLSARNTRKFETVNCAALTRDLLLSELFGHERGAFTGAVAHKAGLLALADGGTAFLDEVGELPSDAQAMLLRFLQDGEVRPLGSTRTTRVDVRVIAATHRDLEAAIAERTFRDDLYYRLSDIVLEVPPLRERREDIAPLVEHFRLKFNDRYGLSVGPPEPAALRTLEAAAWPGNVRELEKVLTQAMIFRRQGPIRSEDLRSPARRASAWAGWRFGPWPLATAPALSRRRAAAIQIANERGVVTRRDLARHCGTSGEVARQDLVALVRLGVLRRVGRGRSTVYLLR
jgi:transcriptional regulator with GAF, ATPase, and Fis domain